MHSTTVAFKTVGCRLNQAETAQLRAVFESAGYAVAPFGHACDVCVIHSCAVTDRAERESLRFARSVKRRFPGVFVVLAGCASEVVSSSRLERGAVDLAVRQSDKWALPDRLRAHGFHPPPGVARRLPRFASKRAIVKVQDGCDFQCAYCIVPRTRGAARSRPLDELVREVAGLAAEGFREIVLTGANIGCYGAGRTRLVHLLEAVEAISGLERIRISSIELSTVEREVIEYMAGSRKLCRFLHLPLQSGDDNILAAMGRRYTIRDYRALRAYAESKVGGIGYGTDLLVGFPGEDEKAFQATETLVRELPFGKLHVFPFSPRPGTPAAARTDSVSRGIVRARVARLMALGEIKRAEFARQWLGREVSVLVENLDEQGRGLGWTGEYLEARLEGPGLTPNRVFRLVPARVEGAVLIGPAAGQISTAKE
ncbi:MAG: MiaB/RimO family radical SAM methylthiotransferase [Lentisphaerae bacterium]|nr:MiaB/RimO family radical SAM methylthiotransferase [Lentisphaerota bacterium]